MPKPIPSTGQTNWGDVLNAHLAQIMNPATGGLNTNAGNPSGLTAEDDGYTFLDTNNGQIKKYKGSGDSTDDANWHIGGKGVNSSSTEPTNPQQGDTWYDTTTNEFKIWNGTEWVTQGGDTFIYEKSFEDADNADLDAAYQDKGATKITFDDNSTAFKVVEQIYKTNIQDGITKILDADGSTVLATITKNKTTGAESVVYA